MKYEIKQLRIYTARNIWKFLQITLALKGRAILGEFSNINKKQRSNHFWFILLVLWQGRFIFYLFQVKKTLLIFIEYMYFFPKENT